MSSSSSSSSSIHDLLSPSEDGAIRERREDRPKSGSPISGTTTHFTIELIIDTICPHCYIGMKNLNAAIETHKARHPEATFELVCSPLVLYPASMRSAHDKIPYYLHTHGGQSNLFETWSRVGSTLGINFSWGGRTGNTRDSHKLLRYALERTPTTTPSTELVQRQRRQTTTPPPPPPRTKMVSSSSSSPPSATKTALPLPRRGPALQMRLLEALFKGYFEHDRDVSDRGFLVEVGAAVGAGVKAFSAADVRRVLESEDWGAAVDMLSDEVRSRLQVDAVPTVIVNGLSLYGGWQKPELFVAEFERLRSGAAARRGMSAG
ncbi:thioredoxin-like protein [Biscogniauxia mediterranea]|nr:thioredoxin-like protein [Biscogniauxia mediterranea]